MSSGIVCIGVGNRHRRDDGVGLVVAERLAERGPGGVKVATDRGDGGAVIDKWEGFRAAVVIDGVRSDEAPGTVHRWEAHRRPLPAMAARHSTHAFGLSQSIELARTLDRLPRRLIVFGIVGKSFSAGEGLSGEVERAADEVVGRVLAEVDRPGARRGREEA